MKNKYFFLSFFLLVFFCGCANDVKYQAIKSTLEAYRFKNEKSNQVVYFIPLDGCGSCIEKSIVFLKKNINSNIKFVVSDYLYKDIRIKIPTQKEHRMNVIADTLMLACINNLVEVAPKVYYIRDEKVIKTIELSNQTPDSVYYSILRYSENL